MSGAHVHVHVHACHTLLPITDIVHTIYRLTHLGVSTTYLDDVLKLVSLLCQRALQLLQSGEKAAVDLHGNSNVHSRGESIVGALTTIDVVVGMNWSF